MNKTYGVSILFTFIFLTSVTPALAAKTEIVTKGSNGGGNTGSQQSDIQSSPTRNTSPTVGQIKNQVNTQNQGEDSAIQVNTEEQGSLQGMPKGESPKNETAGENVSSVSVIVDELLTSKTLKGGIGEQVRLIAQDQKQAQDRIQTELGKIDNQGQFMKLLLGTNYQSVKNIQREMEQNQLRIQQLEELQNQLISQGDISKVSEMIQLLTEQNTSLQDRLTVEEHTRSLFGWLFRFMAK